MRRFLFLIPLVILSAFPACAAIGYNSTGSCVSSNANNCTPSATTIGQIGIAFAIRSGSATAPTCPSSPAWTCPTGTPYTGSSGSGSSAISWRVGCFVWTTTSQASGTWTNAGNVIVLSYSGTATTCATVFGGGSSTGAASTTLTYGVISMHVTNGTSWVVGLGGSRTATNVTSPTGMTNRKQSGTTAMVAGGDTNAGVSSWATTTITVNTATQNVGVVLELLVPSVGLIPRRR